jgi:F-type H+-transporting ATPase subunit epsilon
MHVTVISPERSVFDGEADSVIAPCYDGEVGILSGHAPFMSLLGKGKMTVRKGEIRNEFMVQGGFLQVVKNRVRVVAEHVQGGDNAA